MFTNEKREGINTFVSALSLYVAETPKASNKDLELILHIMPFGIVAYGFVGQPFSKQLYIDTLILQSSFPCLCRIYGYLSISESRMSIIPFPNTALDTG